MMHTTGHHHISMLTKDAQQNNTFYTKVLGLRRVKITVNQDDPSMYHLFYGDTTGSPGTELTFFEMPIAGRTTAGTNAITRIALFVPSYESLVYWQNRLNLNNAITTYANRDALHFTDPDGLALVLVNHNSADAPSTPWNGSDVDADHYILGMATVEITVRDFAHSLTFLTNVLGYEVKTMKPNEALLRTNNDRYSEIKLLQQDGPNERPGRGSIHHLALRVKDVATLHEWQECLVTAGFKTSGVVDRYYFHSLYVHDANGIIYELATDGPGFLHDQTIEALGQQLDLPPKLEPRRQEIEAKLQPFKE